MSGKRREPDKWHLSERIVEKNLIDYVSECQAKKCSNAGDKIQQGFESIAAKKRGEMLFSNRGLEGKVLLFFCCDY
jgi:hypothetical protein